MLNGTFEQNYCDPLCKEKLDAYINFTGGTDENYCRCYRDSCRVGRDALSKHGCIAPSCSHTSAECRKDIPIGCNATFYQYLNDCASILNGSWTNPWCPAKCKASFDAYVNVNFPNFNYTNPTTYWYVFFLRLNIVLVLIYLFMYCK